MRLLPGRKQRSTQGRRHVADSQQPTVFSYYARGKSPGTDNLGRRQDDDAVAGRQRRYQPRARHLPMYLALLSMCIALIYAVLLQPSPRLVVQSLTGTVYRDSIVYQDGIGAIWKQSPLSRTKFTVSTTELSHKIEAQFPELASANIQLPLLGSRPTVVLVPGSPSLQLISNNGAFFVNSSGKVMAEVSRVSQNKLGALPVIRDESGIMVASGRAILSATETDFLVRLGRQLQAANIDVLSITLPKNAAQQADVRLNDQPYYVKFSLLGDARQAVGTYVALKNKLVTDHVTPKEYIDVRVEEKAFYR